MAKLSSLFLLFALFILLFAKPVQAQGWREHVDFHGYHAYDYDHWRSGGWYNGPHDGREGWWWVVDGSWYYYPAPIYPYPDLYAPPTVVVEGTPAPTGASYYYCSDPSGYYPSVTECYGPWQQVVAATPPPDQTIVVPQAPVASAPQAPAEDPRVADERKLNDLAATFAKIDPASADAGKALTKIQKRVEAFRQSLFKRDYNAMDILKNTEDLQHKITEEKAQTTEHKVEIPASAPTLSAPTPPAGTAVTFPAGQP
jgi:hypothetical protein